MYYKNISDGYITSVSTERGQIEIDKAEYDAIIALMHSRPTPPDGYDYRLRADTLEWELVELPPAEPEEDELTADEIVAAIQEAMS